MDTSCDQDVKHGQNMAPPESERWSHPIDNHPIIVISNLSLKMSHSSPAILAILAILCHPCHPHHHPTLSMYSCAHFEPRCHPDLSALGFWIQQFSLHLIRPLSPQDLSHKPWRKLAHGPARPSGLQRISILQADADGESG